MVDSEATGGLDVAVVAAWRQAARQRNGSLRPYGLTGDDLVHAARALRAALHGFASLEAAAGFGLPQDVACSFDWMVGALEAGLVARTDDG